MSTTLRKKIFENCILTLGKFYIKQISISILNCHQESHHRVQAALALEEDIKYDKQLNILAITGEGN